MGNGAKFTSKQEGGGGGGGGNGDGGADMSLASNGSLFSPTTSC